MTVPDFRPDLPEATLLDRSRDLPGWITTQLVTLALAPAMTISAGALVAVLAVLSRYVRRRNFEERLSGDGLRDVFCDYAGMESLVRLEVDGEVFDIATRPDNHGQCDYTWISGRNPGYGFSSVQSDGEPPSHARQVEVIRSFLTQIDPETGYIE